MEELVLVLLEVGAVVRKLVLWVAQSVEDVCGSGCVYGAYLLSW